MIAVPFRGAIAIYAPSNNLCKMQGNYDRSTVPGWGSSLGDGGLCTVLSAKPVRLQVVSPVDAPCGRTSASSVETLQGMRSLLDSFQTEFFHLVTECIITEAQELGCLRLIMVRPLERLKDQVLLQFLERNALFRQYDPVAGGRGRDA
jgi:hypothetical protein